MIYERAYEWKTKIIGYTLDEDVVFKRLHNTQSDKNYPESIKKKRKKWQFLKKMTILIHKVRGKIIKIEKE